MNCKMSHVSTNGICGSTTVAAKSALLGKTVTNNGVLLRIKLPFVHSVVYA